MMHVADTRDCAFEAFITNLGKYNEGFLVGEWMKFPVTNEEMQEVFRRIGIGRRYEESKDYVIAEAQTGKKHTPGVTVWHHVWEKQDGKYRMQLVSFEEHKKTCPHAGGCKLWLLNSTENRVSYRQMEHFEESGDYSDLSLFYPIRNSKIKFYQNGYVSKKTLLFAKKKRAELFGIDVYGNLLYKNNTNLYFWDHEFDLVFSVKNNGQFYQLLLK